MALRPVAIVILVSLLVLALAWGASAVEKPYIKSVKFSPDPLEIDDNFKITIKVGKVTSSTEVTLYLDDNIIPFKKVNIGAEDESVEISIKKEDWADNQQLINIKCGTHSMKVDLTRAGFGTSDLFDTQTLDFDVGNVPILAFDPASPVPGKDVKVMFKDAAGDLLTDQIRVVISYRKNLDTITENKDTGNAGYFTYNPPQPGEYKISVQPNKYNYCGELKFYAKRIPLIDGPHPPNPVVGEMITMAVPAGDIGVKVYDSNGDFYLAARTMITGGVNFTINDAGSYLLVIGELSARHWGVNKTLNVSGRPSLSADIEPENPSVKLPVSITVKANGVPVANANVKIITPEGTQREYKTLANGKVIYDGVTTMGEYSVIVENAKYEPVIKSFKARNGFQLDFDPAIPFLNSEASVLVRDQDGIFVPDAQVSIPELGIVGATDSEGKFSFTISEADTTADPLEYPVTVSKDMFWDLTKRIPTQDTLDIRSPGEVEVGTDVSVNVYNSRGGLLGDDSMSSKVTSPEGEITTINKASFTFKPQSVGSYSIEAGKNNYMANSTVLQVTAHPLEVGIRIEGKELAIAVT
ncbi:MAG: hypothetical protein PHG85_07450, partial [Candidatus Altiarchaeota archaeon]|nr:hypothetical protein [Candidatus Altiarchaeota archaeon]